VTPAFAEGFTVLDGYGQWRGTDGVIVREPSRVVVFLHPPLPELDDRVREILQRYRDDFRQEAVLWERSVACVSLGS
jgi:hypothetical protein